jgi:hypothetical protein
MRNNQNIGENNMPDTMTEIFGDPISVYTADQGVEDGLFADVSEMGHEAGFSKNFKIRVTRSVYDLCTPPKSNKIQSFDGRMWDVLYLAKNAVYRSKDDNFVSFLVRIGRKNETLYATLDTTSGPAIHIMKPEDY